MFANVRQNIFQQLLKLVKINEPLAKFCQLTVKERIECPFSFILQSQRGERSELEACSGRWTGRYRDGSLRRGVVREELRVLSVDDLSHISGYLHG